MYSMEEGKLAVKIAREAIECAVKNRAVKDIKLPNIFKIKSGVFVTINTYPSKELRGCIGYPEPYFPLIDAIKDSANSATQDPRFPRLQEGELNHIVVEVSLLTPPALIKVKDPKDYIKEVVIGKDGLIAEKGQFRGLLLPQVPVEWKWKVDEFLSHTCMKAGLMPDAWLNKDIKIYKFSAEIFMETKPKGEVIKKTL
jgi:uncharacterized protein (TIGR00296 family)